MDQMSTEFSPTQKDLLNLDEKILSLKQDKSKLVQSKINIQNSLTLMQYKYGSVQLGSVEFMKIKSDRRALKEEFQRIEIEIRRINEEVAYKNKLKQEVEFHLRGKANPVIVDNKTVKQLLILKEKYNSFAKDRTRVSSMRIMASEVREEIEKILNGLRENI
jgi:hypothetical protein